MKHSAARLYVTAFIGGVVSLALELSASRLLAPAFGTTDLVWAAIIGLILLYLSVGYALGGRWADRSPEPATLYTILVAAGLSIGLIPILARPVLQLAVSGMAAWNLGLIAGPFVLVLILFVVPVTLLACVSPFVIRLSVDDLMATGATTGRIYAISTLGSFIGTFLPNLLLIPNLGTRRTFLTLAILTTLTGLWGLWASHRRRCLALSWSLAILVALFVIQPSTIKPQAGLLYEDESTSNFIQVVEDASGVRQLLLNEGQGIHSVYDPQGGILTGGPWDYYLIAPYFNAYPHPPAQVSSLLIVGLAGGTTATQFTTVYGPIPFDGVEIDGAIVEAGRRYFGMVQPNLEVLVADGRMALARSQKQYSVIAVDAYRLPYIPWHLTTVEFFGQVRDHLTADGVVAINVGHTEGDWRLVDALRSTMLEVFPSVHTLSVPGSLNAIVVATAQPTEASNLDRNLVLLEDPSLRATAERALDNLVLRESIGPVFTDDRAPVEQITHDLALRYVLGIDGAE